MAWQKRATRDVKELVDCGFRVHPEADGQSEVDLRCFLVDLRGPEDTPYAGRQWSLRFTLPEQFPFKSPSIGFVEKLFHPNVDECSGSVCLDALNKNWSASFTLRHIMEDLIPYLLRYPNPNDPLNREAAAMLLASQDTYAARAKAHSQSHGRSL